MKLLAVFLYIGLSLALAQAADMSKGLVLVGFVSGKVYSYTLDGKNQYLLKKGDKLTEGVIVQTEEAGAATLLFASGSVLYIKPGSKVAIDLYQQSGPMGQEALFNENGQIVASQTKLRLLEGDIVGSVKKLDEASSFDIQALAYSAGIRGTQWWMKLRPVDGSTYDWGFGVAEGSAIVTIPNALKIPVGGQTVINVSGTLAEDQTLDGAAFSPADMPNQQFNAISTAMAKGNALLMALPVSAFKP